MPAEAPATEEADAQQPSSTDRQGSSGSWMNLFTGGFVQYLAVLLGFVGSIAVAFAALRVGGLPINRPQNWWFSLPESWVDDPADYTFHAAVFYVGFALLTLCWLALGVAVRAGRWRVRGLWGVGALWGLPWLAGPVALSTDVFTYLGQGLVQAGGLNPYENGPQTVQLPLELLSRMSPSWLDTPSPYGPLFLGVDSMIAPLSDGHLLRAVLLLRLVQLFGVVLAAVCLPRLARAAGVDPAWATWLGVVSPLLLASAVLSAHNDGLMIGFIVAALALAVSNRWVAAIAVGTLAALVKAPAAVVVVVIALAWLRQSGGLREVGKRIGLTVLAGGLVAAVVSVVSGVGTNWLNFAAISSPSGAALPITPAVSIAVLVDESLQVLGFEPNLTVTLLTVRGLGVLFAGLFALVVLIRQPRLGLTKSVGAIFLVVVLASPVTWPWYLCWPLMLLGASVIAGKARGVLITLTVLAPFVVDPNGTIQPFDKPGAVVIALISLAALAGTVLWCYRNLFRAEQPIQQSPEREQLTAAR